MATIALSARTACEARTDWVALARELSPMFAARAAAHDADDSFVADNYAELKRRKAFSAGVPAELGGGGAAHAELCGLLRELAHACGSTALALSMHTHLVATLVWRWRQGHSVEPLLKRIAAEQIVLIGTGASDWLDSSGSAEKVEGGYRVKARKIFCSGCPLGDLLITTALYDDPQDGPTVLHFGVPFTAPGVTIMDNWRTLGMRATGSHDVMLDGVFVPEGAVSLRRPKGRWHPLYNTIVTLAVPLIMAVYVGIAEAAAALARREAAKKREDAHVVYPVGEMENALVTAQMALAGMVATVAEHSAAPTEQSANAVLIRKTIAARAALQTVEKALEAVGGRGFFRSLGIERLLRDVHGGLFHPLPEKRQLVFTGRLALGFGPVDEPPGENR